MVTVKKFSATWCGPCRMLAPVMNEIKSKYPNVKFEDIDIDDYNEDVETYSVTSVPTVIIEKNGQLLERFTGLQSKMAYQNAINEAIK
jgi:thioredoxin 1